MTTQVPLLIGLMAQSRKVDDISSVYKEKIWGKEEGGEQVKDGYAFRGKRTFKVAREGLERILKRGAKAEKNDVKIRVMDSRIIGVELELEVDYISVRTIFGNVSLTRTLPKVN